MYQQRTWSWMEPFPGQNQDGLNFILQTFYRMYGETTAIASMIGLVTQKIVICIRNVFPRVNIFQQLGVRKETLTLKTFNWNKKNERTLERTRRNNSLNVFSRYCWIKFTIKNSSPFCFYSHVGLNLSIVFELLDY